MYTKNSIELNSSQTILESARKARQETQKRRKARSRDKLAEFMSADIHDSELGIVPEGYGGITYLTFFIFAPWLMGLAFMFFYVSGADLQAYHSLNQSAILTWVIGYEIIAIIILLIIFKKAVTYVLS